MYVDFVVFFFKQKTAYEMRISDWSSDVCSSDLTLPPSPPSPPSGPPNGMYLRRRKLMQPLPPLPPSTRIMASSTNFIVLAYGTDSRVAQDRKSTRLNSSH